MGGISCPTRPWCQGGIPELLQVASGTAHMAGRFDCGLGVILKSRKVKQGNSNNDLKEIKRKNNDIEVDADWVVGN